MTEKWLPVVGYEDLYEVSSLGKVCSLRSSRAKLLVGDVDRDGYRRVNLSRGGKSRSRRVHIIVCEAFHGPRPEGLECRHLNGVKAENHEDNLLWGTRSENVKDQVKHGSHKGSANLVTNYGMAHHASKYSDETIKRLREDATNGMGPRKLARKYGMGHAYAYRLVKGDKRASGTTRKALSDIKAARDDEK